MKVQLVLAGFSLLGWVLAAEGLGPVRGKAPMPMTKGKSVFSPSQKSIKPLPPTKINNAKKEYHEKMLKQNSPNWNTTADQKTSLGKLEGNEPLTDGDRQQLSDLLFNAQASGLSKEDETTLSYLLLDEAARNNVVASASTSPEDKSSPLFLRIYNNTGERLKVFVQVVADVPEKKDKDPDHKEAAKKLDTLQYDLATGKAYDLQQNGKKIQAAAIKVWAISPTRSWAHHRDDPLYMTTPANKSKTYTLTFSDK